MTGFLLAHLTDRSLREMIAMAACMMIDPGLARLVSFSPHVNGVKPIDAFGTGPISPHGIESWLTLLSFESMNKGGARSPPRRLAADSRLEYPRDRESGQGYRGHDRDDNRRRTSRSSPHRGRNAYKDRDREGYRSASGNRSRSRSPRRGQPNMGQVSREVMMDGLPVDMTEEDVSH